MIKLPKGNAYSASVFEGIGTNSLCKMLSVESTENNKDL